MEVEKALHLLKMATTGIINSDSANYCCLPLLTGNRKMINLRVEDANLIVKTIFVDRGKKSEKTYVQHLRVRGHRIQKKIKPRHSF
jgi:hypothetical protein